jgi:hypothetical protein
MRGVGNCARGLPRNQPLGYASGAGSGKLSSTVTFSANRTRDISPPDAISSSGFSGSPALVVIR